MSQGERAEGGRGDCSNRETRPLLTASEQVAFLKAQGVRFEVIGEEDAASFLRERNFFFKIKAFAKNFDRYTRVAEDDPRYGRYVNVDFAYLVELSRLDNYVRSFVLNLSLDVEHALKVRLNKDIMQRHLDPYQVVDDYMAASREKTLKRQREKLALPEARKAIREVGNLAAAFDCEDGDEDAVLSIANEMAMRLRDVTQNLDLDYLSCSIQRMEASRYSRSMVRKYGRIGDMAIWNLMEMVTFGETIGLYRFYFLESGIEESDPEVVLAKSLKGKLKAAQTLRNAAAHNDCLLNTLRSSLKGVQVNRLWNEVEEHYGIGDEVAMPVKRMPLVFDLASLLLCYDKTVPNGNTKNMRIDSALWLADRLALHREYFDGQEEIKNFFKCVDALLAGFAAEQRREAPESYWQ